MTTPPNAPPESDADRYIPVPGGTLRTRWIMPPPASFQGPALVFLHEGLGSIDMWKSFPRLLCRETGLPGMAYERMGYGRSAPCAGQWPKDYQIVEATRYLPVVLEVMGIDTAILIGHSDGGSIALIAAAELKAGLAGVITEAAHVFVEPVTIDGIRRAVAAYKTEGLRKRLFAYHGENTDAVFYRWADTWLDPKFQDWNIETFLPGITCPLLVIQGAEDEYATLAQVEAIAGKVSGPVETAVIPDCRHIPHIQQATETCRIMARFIARVTSGRPQDG